MWKIRTALTIEEIYYTLVSSKLFLEEQERYHKETSRTGDLFYNDQHILKERQPKRKNVAIAWIDNEKPYDRVPQS